MARPPRKPGLLSRTLRRLGPPPLPPRRYRVKFRAYETQRTGSGTHQAPGARPRAVI